jgi:serine/threonine protein kinase
MERAANRIRDYLLGPSLGSHETPRGFQAAHAESGAVVALKLYSLAGPLDYDERAHLRARIDLAGHCAGAALVPLVQTYLEDHRLVVVRELYGEQSLADLLALFGRGERAMPLVLAFDLTLQAAEALAQLHEVMSHGNLKPANLLLQDDRTRRPSGFRLRLVDPALLIPDPRPPDAQTLSYTWTPEQLSGRTPDLPADIYSLGAVLFHCFAGVPPFVAASPDEAAVAHVYRSAPSPLAARPELPANLAALLLRCLAPEPAGRPGARELYDALKLARDDWQQLVPREIYPGVSLSAFAEAFSPFVEVFRRSGARLEPIKHNIPLTGAGLLIGSRDTCGLALPADEIADSHVQLDWDGRGVWVTSLTNTGAVVLGTEPLVDDEPRLWPGDGTLLHIGPYELTLALPRTSLSRATAAPPRPAPNGAVAGRSLRLVGERLSIGVAPTMLAVTPGQVLTAELSIANTGEIVENLQLAMEGAPTTWLQGLPEQINLNPGGQRRVPFQIVVPPVAESVARRYEVRIRADSLVHQGDYVRVELQLTVLPFYGCTVGVRPRQRSGWLRARYMVAVRNLGNAPVTMRLGGEDEEQSLRYGFDPFLMEIEPGRQVSVPLRLSASWPHWFGQRETRSFEVVAQSAETSARGDARFAQRPLIPLWLLTLLPLLLLLALGAIYLSRAVSRFDADLMGMPLYGVLRPTATAAPTASGTAAPEPLAVPLPAIALPALPAVTTSPTPTLTATLTATPTPTSATLTATPTPTATFGPASDGALVYCPRELPIMIEGRADGETAYRLIFHDYPVSLGVFGDPNTNLQTGRDGRFKVPLIVGVSEAAGIYRVQVQTLVGRTLRSFYCRLLPPGAPPPTQTPTPSLTLTPSLTPTPSFSPTPTSTLRPGQPSPTATPTPADTATPEPTSTLAPALEGEVAACVPGGTLLIEGNGPPGAALAAWAGTTPLAAASGAGDLGTVADDGTFRVEVSLASLQGPGVVAIAVETVDVQVLRSFYCDLYGATATPRPAEPTPAAAPGEIAPTPTATAAG